MKLLARASAGLIVWAFGFSLLYALHGFGCAKGWAGVSLLTGSLFGWVMGTAWVAMIAVSAATAWWVWTRLEGFERKLAIASAAAGFVAIVVTGAPTALVSACV